MFIKIILFPFFLIGLASIITTILGLSGLMGKIFKFLYKKFLTFNLRVRFMILFWLIIFLTYFCQQILDNKKKEALINRSINQIAEDCEKCQLKKVDCTQECWYW